MFEKTFKVKYITSKNCFCYLSDKYSKVLRQSSIGKVLFKDKLYYFSLGSHLTSLKENEIGLNGLYANLLDLKENDHVTFVQHDNVSKAVSLDISPCHKDDLEILELMAENVQNTLLNQIRIVNNNQKAIIWLSDSIHIIVDIDGVTPMNPGCLEYLTEVAIKAPNPNIRAKSKSACNKWSVSDWLNYVKLQSDINQNILERHQQKRTCIFRVFSMETSKKITFANDSPFNVYTPKSRLPPSITMDSVYNCFTLYPIYLSMENNEHIDKQKDIVVRLCPLENIDGEIKFSNFVPLFVNDEILKYYKLTTGAKVVLDSEVNIGTATKVEILTNAHNLQQVKQQFKSMVGNALEDKVLINSDVPFSISNNKIVLKFTPDNFTACVLDSNFIRNGDISVTQADLVETKDSAQKEKNDICITLTNLKRIIFGCRLCLNTALGSPEELEHILIVGKCGSGKTTIVSYFSEIVSVQPYYIYTETVNCKNIKGKSLDSLHKLLANTLVKLIYYQPSILFIDDIHAICEKVMEEDIVLKESVSLVSQMVVSFFEDVIKHNFIMVVATTESTSKLNQHLLTSRGNHIFKNIFTINELNEDDRKAFLKFGLSKCGSIVEDADIDFLSMKTEGYVIQDLVDFVDKCVFESYKEDSSDVNLNHCLNAIDVSSSLSLRNVQIYSTGDRDFSDIGGLDDAKKVLMESMMWPVKYTNIFGNSPLRLQSGILLYGPPGTGKTILAGAAAKQCGLRLISIKGPELLSKYIGESEQAVRDIFQKAQAAKPCILFFDEFDSLAPRRGHDITGVTDRVVNQFLTQLDGIESLIGVCVLAATSRPDLLDPALLRPGRLDQQIFCPLPTQEDRLSIMKALSKTLHFAEDVNLEEIAAQTEGYSGADLQSILYTAQLTSMEHLLNETEIEKTHSEMPVTIYQHHMNDALKNTRPSLTKDEHAKYERIYAKFQGKIDVDDIRKGKQKATLA